MICRGRSLSLSEPLSTLYSFLTYGFSYLYYYKAVRSKIGVAGASNKREVGREGYQSQVREKRLFIWE